jgi:hypothetical protein
MHDILFSQQKSKYDLKHSPNGDFYILSINSPILLQYVIPIAFKDECLVEMDGGAL